MKLIPSLLIEKNISNTLSATEKLEFDILYANDEQFRATVHCSKAITEIIQHEKEMAMWKKRFETWGKLKPIETMDEKKTLHHKKRKRCVSLSLPL
jgi:hypothetical protein